jgi:hypothetical protein
LNFFKLKGMMSIHYVDFLFYLNDHLEFENAKFDELPIKYTIISCKLEIYGIWFDQSLKMKIAQLSDEFTNKYPTISTKFNLKWLPNAVLMNSMIKKVSKEFFNYLVFNIDTMEIEIKEDNQDQLGLQKICDNWNKVLKRKFKLKWFKHDILQMDTKEGVYLKDTMLSFPPEVNCFIIDNPFITRIKNRYNIDDFSAFRHKADITAWYAIYNSKEELSYFEAINFIANNIHQLHISPFQKFSFKYTSEMKDFINENLQNWVFEVIGMDNKLKPSFIANVYPLSGNKLDFKNAIEPFDKESCEKQPLILTDLEQMKLFTKLTEKTSTDDEPSKTMLSREPIPNFYKNLNAAYSWQIHKVMHKILSEYDERFNLFNDNFFGFYLEIIEAADVYIVKNEKSQEIISKMLNNIDLKKNSLFRIMNYIPYNGRTNSEFERMWVNALNSNINRTYWLINIISYIEFERRVEEFMRGYREKEGKTNNSFDFLEGWKINESYIGSSFINLMKQNCGNFRFRNWVHWKADKFNSPEEKFMTRRERFKLENQVAGEIVKNIEKLDFRHFIFHGWRNHVIPFVFANMKKDIGGFISAQHQLKDMFELSTLEISFDIFKEYFNDDNVRKIFFDEEDYEKDDIKKTIIIKNWLMIPILGTLKMSDDYKNGWVKEGFELEPYGTFTDPKNEKPYVQIQLDQIRKGECGKEFIGEPCSLADYEKIYELNNWHAHLTFNGVKYFYFVQDKQSSIVVKEVSIHIRFRIHEIYKFLYSSNPIDLITTAMKFSHQPLQQAIGL